MRVLVSGSTGFIGRQLVARLRGRGDEVIPIRRSAAGTRPGAGVGPGEVGLDLERGQLTTEHLTDGTLEGVDASIHLAGAPIIGRWTEARRRAIRQSRVEAGRIIAEHLADLDNPPAVHVTGSAIGYYGDGGNDELDEDSAPGKGFLAEVCRDWEAAAEPAEAAGIRTVAIRTGIVIGRGGALGPQLPLFKLGLGGRLGSGRQWVSWISLDDEVSAILTAIDDSTLSGPVNATSPNPVTNADFTTALARAVHRPAVLPVPAAALRLALGAGPAEQMLLASQRVLPRRLISVGFPFARPTIDAALAVAVRGTDS